MRRQLPTITVDSPKAWPDADSSYSNFNSSPTASSQQQQQQQTATSFECRVVGEDSVCSDSDCVDQPDTEGVKSLFLNQLQHSLDPVRPISAAYEQKLYDSFRDYDQGLVHMTPGYYADVYVDPWGPMQLPYLQDEEELVEVEEEEGEGGGYGADYQTFAPITEVDEEIRQESSRCSTSSSSSFEDTGPTTDNTFDSSTSEVCSLVHPIPTFILQSRCRHLSLELKSTAPASRLPKLPSSYPMLPTDKLCVLACQKILHANVCHKQSTVDVSEDIVETQGLPSGQYNLRDAYSYESPLLLHAVTRQLNTKFWDASTVRNIVNCPSKRARVGHEDQRLFYLTISQTPIEYSYAPRETSPSFTVQKEIMPTDDRDARHTVEDTVGMFSQTFENSVLQLWDGTECLYEERRQEDAEMPKIIIMPENVCTSEDDEEEEEENGHQNEKDTLTELPGKAEETFLSIRRCRNFENISQLSLSPVLEENGDTSAFDFNSKIGVSSAGAECFDQSIPWETNYSTSFDGLPIHRWGRSSKSPFSSLTVAVGDVPASLSIFAEDQVLEKHDDRVWAGLFAPSECIIQSAKGISTRLEEMAHIDENEEFDVADLRKSTGQVNPDEDAKALFSSIQPINESTENSEISSIPVTEFASKVPYPVSTPLALPATNSQHTQNDPTEKAPVTDSHGVRLESSTTTAWKAPKAHRCLPTLPKNTSTPRLSSQELPSTTTTTTADSLSGLGQKLGTGNRLTARQAVGCQTTAFETEADDADHVTCSVSTKEAMPLPPAPSSSSPPPSAHSSTSLSQTDQPSRQQSAAGDRTSAGDGQTGRRPGRDADREADRRARARTSPSLPTPSSPPTHRPTSTELYSLPDQHRSADRTGQLHSQTAGAGKATRESTTKAEEAEEGVEIRHEGGGGADAEDFTTSAVTGTPTSSDNQSYSSSGGGGGVIHSNRNTEFGPTGGQLATRPAFCFTQLAQADSAGKGLQELVVTETGGRTAVFGGCLWTALCRLPRISLSQYFFAQPNRQPIDYTRRRARAIEALIRTSDQEQDPSDAVLSLLQDSKPVFSSTYTNSTRQVASGRCLKTRRLTLTQIYDTTIEHEETECSLLQDFASFGENYLLTEATSALHPLNLETDSTVGLLTQHLCATALHLLPTVQSSIPWTTGSAATTTMNMDSIRRRRSQSYVSSGEASQTYLPLHRSSPRLPDLASSENRTRSYTLSSAPRAANSPRVRQYYEQGNVFPAMWSPPLNKSSSTCFSPGQTLKTSQVNSRVSGSRSKEGSASAAATNSRPIGSGSGGGSLLRPSRYSLGPLDRNALDEYTSGDSGSSTGSQRPRLTEPMQLQRWPPKRQPGEPKAAFSPAGDNLGGETRAMRPIRDYSRSSTLPYKRRGSWHVDRRLDSSLADFNSPRSVLEDKWSQRSRWRSFSPERLTSLLSEGSVDGPAGRHYISETTLNLTSTLPFYNRQRSLQSKHIKELAKSTEQLSTGFLDSYQGFETSFDTLRANLEAATSESRLLDRQFVKAKPYRYSEVTGSTDRLFGRDMTAERLRRQCEREHRRLLKSLMSDNWEKSLLSVGPSAESSPGMGASVAAQPAILPTLSQSYSAEYPIRYPTDAQKPDAYLGASPKPLTAANGAVLPVREATVLTAPRTTNQDLVAGLNFDAASLEKLLRSPALAQLLNQQSASAAATGGGAGDCSDQSAFTDQVTLAAVAGAAAATAMANAGILGSTEAPTYPEGGYEAANIDWNDPETLLAAYNALAEASGGEEALLQQLTPELAATLLHHQREVSAKLAGEQAFEAQTRPTLSQPQSTALAEKAPEEKTRAYASEAGSTRTIPVSSYLENEGQTRHQSKPSFLLEDVSRQAGEKESYDGRDATRTNQVASSNGAPASASINKNFDSTPKKIVRHSYDFPTKRILLMRNSKDRHAGGNGFGIKIAGGRKRTDGHLGSFVDQVISGETLSYLHGEISEGDEIIEWNGTVLIDKEAAEVQAIVNTPADEAELLVRSNPTPSESSFVRRYPQEFPLHTCPHKSPCAADAHRHAKLCPSHNQVPSHMHEATHSCFHQHPHTCQRSFPLHCEVHPCMHKAHMSGLQHPALGHVCRNDWPDGAPAYAAAARGGKTTTTTSVIDETHRLPQTQSLHCNRLSYPQLSSLENQEPSSPANNGASCVESEASASPSRSLHTAGSRGRQSGRQNFATPPSPRPPGTEETQANKRDASDGVSHQSGSGGMTVDDPSVQSDSAESHKSFGEIELILTFDDYDQSLTVHVARARGLRPMDLNGLADPFVKLRLHPDPTEE
nr:unnamed protein product [Spirometra erinaceieuropaei]